MKEIAIQEHVLKNTFKVAQDMELAAIDISSRERERERERERPTIFLTNNKG